MDLMPPRAAVTLREIYDCALRYAHDKNLPPDAPRPHPIDAWPAGNFELYERYQAWLLEGGTSEIATRTIYLPIAGHVLGLNLKPHTEFDLDADLERAYAYVQAKGAGPDWLDACRHGISLFQRFLRLERGLGLPTACKPFDLAAHSQGLPLWLVNELTRFQHIQQRNWRPERLESSIHRFWCGHIRMWRFLVEQCGVHQLSDLKRVHVFDYVDFRLNAGHSVNGVNGDIHTLRSFLVFLQEEGYPVPQSLLRLKGLKTPEPLPKFLPDDQVQRLREQIERQAAQAVFPSHRRIQLLTRAAFYLLWQGGMRLGEVEDLRLEDLDLAHQRLTVRKGKSLKDRTVFLTATAVSALQDYLAVRGPGASDHVFLYRNQALRKDLIRARIQLAGQAVGVKVYPHRLRHTCATQLLNAGCRITSIQRFLGHKKLNTTMIYAKAHDQTVADDYYAAMSRIEQRLEIVPLEPDHPPEPDPEQEELLSLTEQLAQPELSLEQRLLLVAQMRLILRRETKMTPTGEISISIASAHPHIFCESAVEGECAALGP
jgi:site-specific recombinase XerD